MDVQKVSKEDWKAFSESAHWAVFSEEKPESLDRIDFALLAIKDDKPYGYMTCREFDSETVYWQYGGVFEQYKKTIYAMKVYEAFKEWHKKNYKRCVTYIENTNRPMLKMAAKIGYVITGIRNYKGDVLLEHLLEFGTKEDGFQTC